MAVFQQFAKFEEQEERNIFLEKVHGNPLNSMCLMYTIMDLLNPSDLQKLKSTSSVFEKHISSISETSIIDRRIGALSGTRVTEIKEDHISEDNFVEILQKTQLDNSVVVVFLRELLKLKKNGKNIFYIGGSTALMFASLVHNIEIDISLYDNSDNDIYVIGDIEIEEAQELLKTTIQKYLPEDFSYMYIKTHFTNMVPKEEDAKVSQFVHHIKEDMGKHFEFVDLPITQFLVGDGILYGTIFAHYALQTGINILGGKINDAVVNRIIKYIDRGYHFVSIGDQPIGLLKDLSLKITRVYLIKYFCSDLHELKVDTNLKDFEFMLKADRNVIDRLDFDKKYPKSLKIRLSNRRTTLHGSDKISKYRSTYRNDITEVVSSNTSFPSIFKLMEQMDIIDKSVNSRIVTKVTTERVKIYHDDMFGGSHLYSGDNYDYIVNDIIEVRNIIETKFKVNQQKLYKYKDDERYHTANRYEQWLISERENNNKPFYQVLTISQFCSIPNLIYFKEFTSYFLNKNNCKMGIDGNYYPITSEIPERMVNFYCRTLQEPMIAPDDDGFTLVTKKRH